MSFNPPVAFNNAFTDYWNITQAFAQGGMTPKSYMQAARQSYETFNAILNMTFWSIFGNVKDDIPEDIFHEEMRKLADAEYGFDGLTAEQRTARMIELIENTMLQINPDALGEPHGHEH